MAGDDALQWSRVQRRGAEIPAVTLLRAREPPDRGVNPVTTKVGKPDSTPVCGRCDGAVLLDAARAIELCGAEMLETRGTELGTVWSVIVIVALVACIGSIPIGFAALLMAQ